VSALRSDKDADVRYLIAHLPEQRNIPPSDDDDDDLVSVTTKDNSKKLSCVRSTDLNIKWC
jgi:hypothetical protein